MKYYTVGTLPHRQWIKADSPEEAIVIARKIAAQALRKGYHSTYGNPASYQSVEAVRSSYAKMLKGDFGTVQEHERLS